MIICICHNVSDKKVEKIIQDKSIFNIKQLQKEVVICNQCKICASEVNCLIKKHKENTHSKKIPIILESSSIEANIFSLEN